MEALKKMIYQRKSFRKYTSQVIEQPMLDEIKQFIKQVKPLYPNIKVVCKIVSKNKVKCILPWIPNYNLVIFSEEKEGYLENVGFMFQQVDLYLQSKGIGSCWLGMGRSEEVIEGMNNLKMAMIITFGYSEENYRHHPNEFKRKSLKQISDQEDLNLIPVLLAPSSVNSQPWYFTHEQDLIHIYLHQHPLWNKQLEKMNCIDIGIALAHMYVANHETFNFIIKPTPYKKGYSYKGSFKI